MRDDVRYVSEWEVRTPSLVEEIDSFVNEDQRESLLTVAIQFGVGEATVHRIKQRVLRVSNGEQKKGQIDYVEFKCPWVW